MNHRSIFGDVDELGFVGAHPGTQTISVRTVDTTVHDQIGVLVSVVIKLILSSHFVRVEQIILSAFSGKKLSIQMTQYRHVSRTLKNRQRARVSTRRDPIRVSVGVQIVTNDKSAYPI